MAQLRKRDAEELLSAIEESFLPDIVLAKLRIVLDAPVSAQGGHMRDEEILRLAGTTAGWEPELVARLVARERTAFEDLAVELSERRTLTPEKLPQSAKGD